MDIEKTIAKLELKNMLEKFLDLVDYPINASLADAQKWTRKNLSMFRSYVKALLPPCSRICFWVMRPNIYGAVATVDFYELKDGYAEIKLLHAPDYDENDAENIKSIQSIHEDEFFHMLRRAIIFNLFFFPINPKSKNLEFISLILQLLGANT